MGEPSGSAQHDMGPVIFISFYNLQSGVSQMSNEGLSCRSSKFASTLYVCLYVREADSQQMLATRAQSHAYDTLGPSAGRRT